MKKYLKKPELIIAVVATIFRFIISNALGIWYQQDATSDEVFFLNASNLKAHFLTHDPTSLIKTMSYAVFLFLVDLSSFSYVIILTLVWVIAAILTVRLFKTFLDNKWFLLFVYLFTLFTPCAFELWLGTKLYRNSIIAPFVLITFCLIFINLVKIILENNFKIKRLLGLNIALGIIFTFTYYIKEDGIWLLPCLLLAMLINIAYLIFQKYKNKINIKNLAKLSVVIVLPVLMFVFLTNCYKAINYHYFGIYEINTRTEGECGKFVENIYKIDSPDQNKCVWAPWDSIEKAFDASPTLRSKPELKETIHSGTWLGNIEKQTLNGDFLTWCLRDALAKTGMYTSEKDVSDFFKQVNVELDQAFKNGTLPKSHKFQISSSGGGRTLNEILDLRFGVLQSYKCNVLLSGYLPGGTSNYIQDSDQLVKVTGIINMFATQNDSFFPDNSLGFSKINFVNKITKCVFYLYKLINPILFVISVISIIFAIFNLNSKKRKFCIFSSIILLGISAVYAICVSWFDEFLGYYNHWHIFYSVENIPILLMFYLFGLVLFIENIKLLKEKRKPKNLIN